MSPAFSKPSTKIRKPNTVSGIVGTFSKRTILVVGNPTPGDTNRLDLKIYEYEGEKMTLDLNRDVLKTN